MSEQKTFAVVIPFAKNILLLSQQVDALIPQLSGRSDGILVLSCNSAELYYSPETNLLINKIQQENVNVSLIDSSAKKGPSFARNSAWKQTKSTFFLFCDDDDVVGPNWVNALLSKLQVYDLAGGSLDYQALNETEYSSWQPSRNAELPTKFSHLAFSPTCNLGVSARVLHATGGFDEELICAQDIDFCWRAQYMGYELALAEDALVNYRLRDSNKAIYLQAYRYGKGDALLLKKHQIFGARVTYVDTARGLASLTINSLKAPFNKRNSGKASHRWGLTLGHLIGSIKTKVWVL